MSAESDRIRLAYARRNNHAQYSMFEPAHTLMVQERERKLLRLLASRGIRSLKQSAILEVGCGTGFWLQQFVRWGAHPENLVGVDLLEERLAEARCKCAPGIKLLWQSAENLSGVGDKFDLILQSTVLTSILDRRMKHQVAAEMLRVLKPGGLIVWYDFHFNNPSNPDVRGIGKKEIHQLFPGCRIHLERLTLAPPLGRPLARISPTLYNIVSAIKPFCSHYLGIISTS